MSRPVLFVHVGLMKTGTTYLQGVLDANREALAGAGVNFVGSSWTRQVRAAQDLLQLDQHDPQIATLSAGAWDALMAEVREHRDATNVVSMEFLSFAGRRSVGRLTRALAGIDARVVVTVRDATATIPAQWQTSITSGSTLGWEQFQSGVQRAVRPWWAAAALADPAVREFRRTQDVRRVLDVWGKVVPADRLHVVTVPRGGREANLLWPRFAEVVGVDPALATEPARTANPSIGYASTELVRHLNLVLADIPPWDYNRTVKAPLASSILAARRPQERRPVLDPATAAVAGAWNTRSRDAIADSGARFVGDWDDLPVAAPSSAPVDTAPPSRAELLEAAATAWHGLVDLVDRRRRRVARIMGATPPASLAPQLPDWLERGRSEADLDGAVRDLSALVRTSVQLRREVLELREIADSDTTEADSAD